MCSTFTSLLRRRKRGTCISPRYTEQCILNVSLFYYAELRSKTQQLEQNLQVQGQEMKLHMSKCQETQLQLDDTKRKLIEKDKALNKSWNEITRITTQLDQTTVLVKLCPGT